MGKIWLVLNRLLDWLVNGVSQKFGIAVDGDQFILPQFALAVLVG